jgi:hypothetical protein
MAGQWSSPLRQAGLIAAVALALYAQRALHQDYGQVSAWCALAAGAALAAAAAGRCALPRVRVPALPAASTAQVIGAALSLMPIAAATVLGAMGRLPVLALALWLAAPVIASLAVRHWHAGGTDEDREPWTRAELNALAALLIVAALARTLWLATLPRAYFGDEPRVGMFLINAFRDGNVPGFFRMGWNTWPVIGLALQGVFAPLFGVHVWTLRLSSALMGTLAVLATYLVARELFAARTALLAAALFAICRTAIDFSRLGIAHAQIMFLEPLALLLFWRALRGGRAAQYIWAGAAAAWCLFSYNAGQLVPPLLFGWLAIGAVADRRRLRTHWRGAALFAAAFTATLFPYLVHFTDAFTFGPNWDQWTIMARNRQTLDVMRDAWQAGGIGAAWAVLWRQTWVTWLGFGVLPGGGYGIGYRRGGMFDDVSAALFVLGLAIALRRARCAGEGFIAYWWALTVIAGGIVTVDPPSFVRMIGLLPAVAILAALPLAALLDLGGNAVTRRAVAGLVVLALVGAAVWENYRTYFVEFASTAADPMSELVRYAQALPNRMNVVVVGPEHFLQYDGELTRLEIPDRGWDVMEPAHFLPIHQRITTAVALLLTPTQTTLADYIRKLYPSATIDTPLAGDGKPGIFRSVIVSPDDALRLTGLAVDAQHADGTTAPLGERDPFAARIELPPGTDRLRWAGQVYWPSSDPVRITVDAGQPMTLALGDLPPIVADGVRPASAPLTLPRGWQPIRIQEAAAPQRKLVITVSAPQGRALNRWDMRPDTVRAGLSATYLRGDGTTVHALDPALDAYATEDLQRIDGDLVVHMPFRATWRGALTIDTAGLYQFEALGSGPYRVELDGTLLFAQAPDTPEEPALAQATRTLGVGRHPLEVEFDSTKPAHTSRRIFQLFWTPPGGAKALIPPSAFVPDEGRS